jgi:hypothetical protein
MAPNARIKIIVFLDMTPYTLVHSYISIKVEAITIQKTVILIFQEATVAADTCLLAVT